MIQADIDALNALMPRPAKVALTIKRICDMQDLQPLVDTELARPGNSIITVTGVTDQ